MGEGLRTNYNWCSSDTCKQIYNYNKDCHCESNSCTHKICYQNKNIWPFKNKCKEQDKDKDKDKGCDSVNEEKVNYSNLINKACCCDTSTLRTILEFFRAAAETDIKVSIVTKTDKFTGYIFDLTEDILYISPEKNSKPHEFIPICNIVAVFADKIVPKPLCHKLKEKIEYLMNSTCDSTPCCCANEMANVISSIRRFNDSKTHLCFNLDTLFTISSGFFCINIGDIAKVNKDVIFIINENNYSIIVTCAITSVSLCKAKSSNDSTSSEGNSTQVQESNNSEISEEENSTQAQKSSDSEVSEE